jgi:hypothetical protein
MRSKTPDKRVRKTVLGFLVLAVVLVTVVIINGQVAAGPGTTGPGVVVMDNIEGSMGAVTFDHDAHTFMAEGCASCHHNHGSDNGRCADCHEIGAEQFKISVRHSFLACGNCHGGIDPDSPGMPSLKVALHNTCLSCHRDMGNIGKSPLGCTEQCHVSPAG